MRNDKRKMIMVMKMSENIPTNGNGKQQHPVLYTYSVNCVRVCAGDKGEKIYSGDKNKEIMAIATTTTTPTPKYKRKKRKKINGNSENIAACSSVNAEK